MSAVILRDLLPEALQNIKKRCEDNPDNKDFHSEHTRGVMSAVNGFMSGKKPSRPKAGSKRKLLQVGAL